MSVKIMSMVWELPNHFSCSEKMVLLKLADHADDDGGHVFPSKERMADRCSLDVRTVRKVMAKFEQDGLLVKVAERLGMPTIYRIELKKLQQMLAEPTPYKNEGGTKMNPLHSDPPTPSTEARPPLAPRPAHPSVTTNNHQEGEGDFAPPATTDITPAAVAELPEPVLPECIAHYPKVKVRDGWFELPAPYCDHHEIQASMCDFVTRRMSSKDKTKQLTVRALELATRWWSKYPVEAVAHSANYSSENGYRGLFEEKAKEWKPERADARSIEQIAGGRIATMEERQRLLREAAAKVQPALGTR